MTTSMQRRDVAELLVLAALWGASFLFMRLGAVEFGALALSFLRVAGASIVLLPLAGARGELPALARHAGPIAVVGVFNSALPFALYSDALTSIAAGLSSIFNAAAPLFAAVIAWGWLGEKLSAVRSVGLLVGFAGVIGLAASRSSLGGAALWPVLECLLATLSYGFAANYTKRRLADVPSTAAAAGSQLAAAIVLAPFALAHWPAQPPSATAWLAAAALAVLCTGIAYGLYFRLIARVGPGNAIAVTFLVPAFAVLWGRLFLGEVPTLAMLAGCAVILLGTAIATGVLRLPVGQAQRSP